MITSVVSASMKLRYLFHVDTLLLHSFGLKQGLRLTQIISFLEYVYVRTLSTKIQHLVSPEMRGRGGGKGRRGTNAFHDIPKNPSPLLASLGRREKNTGPTTSRSTSQLAPTNFPRPISLPCTLSFLSLPRSPSLSLSPSPLPSPKQARGSKSRVRLQGVTLGRSLEPRRRSPWPPHWRARVRRGIHPRRNSGVGCRYPGLACVYTVLRYAPAYLSESDAAVGGPPSSSYFSPSYTVRQMG